MYFNTCAMYQYSIGQVQYLVPSVVGYMNLLLASKWLLNECHKLEPFATFIVKVQGVEQNVEKLFPVYPITGTAGILLGVRHTWYRLILVHVPVTFFCGSFHHLVRNYQILNLYSSNIYGEDLQKLSKRVQLTCSSMG